MQDAEISFSNGRSAFDPSAVADGLAKATAKVVADLGRRGAVIAVSGGVDSGVVAGICARGLGPERIMLLRLPERAISDESTDLGLQLAEKLGAPSAEQSITPALEGLGYFELRDSAIRAVFPDFEPDWPHKIVRSEPTGGITVFSLVVQRPDGQQESRRMPSGPYRDLLAAQNMKQRTRKLIEYTWADRLHYAVIGTPNFLEYDQGFFVKGGDGLADVKPIAGLYKGEVYALARELDLPEGIAGRSPTTETFSLPQSQEEFYFGHPYDRMDALVRAQGSGVAPAELAPHVGLTPDEVRAAYTEIERRRVATEYLHAAAVLPTWED